MKNIFIILTLASTAFAADINSSAKACSTKVDNYLMWPRDQVLGQIECSNRKVTICVTRAVWGYNNEEYYSLNGVNDQGYNEVHQVVFTKQDKNGSIKKGSSIEILTAPTPAVMIDQYKYKYTMNISVPAKTALYKSERKETYSFQSWKTLRSESLNCK